jgi:hypothetical protein
MMLNFLFWIVAGPVLVIVVCLAWLWLLSLVLKNIIGG